MRKRLRDLHQEFPSAEITVNGRGHYALDLGTFIVIAAATPRTRGQSTICVPKFVVG